MSKETDKQELYKALMGLFQEAEEENRNSIPLPCDLTDKESQCVLMSRMILAFPDSEVTESEIAELIERANTAKWNWFIFRAHMAGIVNLSIVNDELMVRLSDGFVRENPDLKNQIEAALKAKV